MFTDSVRKIRSQSNQAKLLVAFFLIQHSTQYFILFNNSKVGTTIAQFFISLTTFFITHGG